MIKTHVINLTSGEPYDVYIGRRNQRYGLTASPFANPYRIGKDGSRDEVLDKYEAWLMQQPKLLALIPKLAGKTLGCYCKPEACHGDILARLADEMARDEAHRDLAHRTGW